jgi:glycosyltransferase involved in cell wall biosynthesis
MRIGIDLEQFVTDPFASGVQRVVQYLAKEWPTDVPADWIVPVSDGTYKLLTSEEAAELLTIPFENPMHVSELPGAIEAAIINVTAPAITESDLYTTYNLWFLPEVCYTPKVLKRFEKIQKNTKTAMIGFDVLPMSDPYNYMFTPGTLATVSEYFRLIATTDILLCISDFTKDQAENFLRRSKNLTTTVIHPGGDHVSIATGGSLGHPVTYLRLGTMEARKQPVEILQAFLESDAAKNETAVLHFVGAPARVDVDINFAVERAIAAGFPVRWTADASDQLAIELTKNADAFLSYGREGYGIPVLEAIRLGTPVLFDGVQPAAELMQGNGAHRVPIDQVFSVQSPQSITRVDQETVPTWRNYAQEIATTLVDSMKEGNS